MLHERRVVPPAAVGRRDPRLLREAGHGPARRAVLLRLGAVGQLGERVEHAGKVGVVVEVGRLEQVGLLQAERRGQAAQEGPETKRDNGKLSWSCVGMVKQVDAVGSVLNVLAP